MKIDNVPMTVAIRACVINELFHYIVSEGINKQLLCPPMTPDLISKAYVKRTKGI